MSPLGAAIVGHKIGDSASYTAPNGREISVKILDATPFKV
jgi:transcription elongation factor GreA